MLLQLVILLVFACSLTSQALTDRQANGNRSSERKANRERVAALLQIFEADNCHPYSESDMSAANSALSFFRGVHDDAGTIEALILQGKLYINSGNYNRAVITLREALALFPAVRNARDETTVLTLLGNAYNDAGKNKQAIEVLNKAIRNASSPVDKPALARALAYLGESLGASDPNRSNDSLQRALKIARGINDLSTQAEVLNDQAAASQDNDPDLAANLYEQALKIADEGHDCRDKASTLANLASLEVDRGELTKALRSYTVAVQVERELGDKTAEAQVLHGLAYLYDNVGDFNTSLADFKQALELEQANGSRSAEAQTLSAMAGVYKEMNRPQLALQTYKRTIPLLGETGNLQWQALATNNMGAVEADLGHPQQARALYDSAVRMSNRLGNRLFPAFSYWGIGELEQSDALPNYIRALHIAEESEQPGLVGIIDFDLMKHFRSAKENGVAIYFGKDAVDNFQLIRRNMGGLGDSFVSDFLQSKAQCYRTLAELLIEESRLTEAQQILDLLKIQEYSDYVRAAPKDLVANPTRTATEALLKKECALVDADLIGADRRLQNFRTEHHNPEDPDYVRVLGEVRQADNAFDACLRDLHLRLRTQGRDPDELVRHLTQQMSILQNLLQSEPQTAAIYTLMGDDQYRAIVVTGRLRIWKSYSISKKALAKKCEQFRQLLISKSDVTEEAQELFTIIFGPVQKEVQELGASQLLWYLDGALRYIPISALVDPHTGKYLLESYTLIDYEPVTPSFDHVPDMTNPTAIGMGTSRKYDLPKLEYVEDELKAVVTDSHVPGSHGPLPGTILLNDKFTEKAMNADVASQSVVHFATHFVLTPGDDHLSYLVLGGKNQDSQGYDLPVSDLSLDLQKTELVTLSACETATSNADPRDGFEEEGVSYVMLRHGAKAVISSLWAVNDASTEALMADFYQSWIGSAGKLSKSKVLRDAELNILHGKVVPPEDPSAPASFAHPYYWSAFVLMGNWK